jgi:hypothetical protein
VYHVVPLSNPRSIRGTTKSKKSRSPGTGVV